jgi:hypothetical protein
MIWPLRVLAAEASLVPPGKRLNRCQLARKTLIMTCSRSCDVGGRAMTCFGAKKAAHSGHCPGALRRIYRNDVPTLIPVCLRNHARALLSFALSVSLIWILQGATLTVR